MPLPDLIGQGGQWLQRNKDQIAGGALGGVPGAIADHVLPGKRLPLADVVSPLGSKALDKFFPPPAPPAPPAAPPPPMRTLQRLPDPPAKLKDTGLQGAVGGLGAPGDWPQIPGPGGFNVGQFGGRNIPDNWEPAGFPHNEDLHPSGGLRIDKPWNIEQWGPGMDRNITVPKYTKPTDEPIGGFKFGPMRERDPWQENILEQMQRGRPQPVDPLNIGRQLDKQGSVESWGDLAKILGGGMAVGAGARSAIGLGQLLSGLIRPRPVASPPPVIIDLPYSERAKEETPPAIKAAETTLAGIFGNPATWSMATKFVGAPLAALGGFAGVDQLMRWQKRRRAKQDLADARDEYRTLAIGGRQPLDPEQLDKVASLYETLLSGSFLQDAATVKAAAAIDRLVDERVERVQATRRQHPLYRWAEKCALNKEGNISEFIGRAADNWGDFLDRTGNWFTKDLPNAAMENIVTPAAGPYLAVGSGLGLMAGAAGYNIARKEDPEAIKAKEMKDRLEAGQLMESPQVFARLVPAAKKRAVGGT